ncbi:MAG TPA: hypothetical protein VKY26_01450 [Actinomycetota bacterium]|nr:hypothetical protein [Actinomycetota bacterium]
MSWRPESTFVAHPPGAAAKGVRLGAWSVALGVLGLAWYVLAPALGLLLGAQIELDLLYLWPMVTVSAIVCGFAAGHLLETIGWPTRRAVTGIVLGFVGLPFSLVVAGYFLFIRFGVSPAV